ncbi:WIAG-tail domain [Paenibacillus terrae]|uniref:WIAG-tail domain n=1 Tax=Paenibacillus terrae TaxID=159743 RepID=UPI0011EADEDD|nr:WIAG-tail domain [Paenibacillus terrae]
MIPSRVNEAERPLVHFCAKGAVIMNHNSKDKRTVRRNLSNAVPSPRIDKNKTAPPSGNSKQIQRETVSVKSIVESQAQAHDLIAVDEAAWRKHKLPKTLEEAMLLNRGSVLLLSVPETDAEPGTEYGLTSVTSRGQIEQESLLDCSITSIHIAEGRHRPKQQRVALSADKPVAALTDDDESPLNMTYDVGLLREHTFNSRAASTRFGSIPFHIPAEACRDEVSIVFEQPFKDVHYAITGNASIPGVTVSVTKCQRDSTVFTVERGHAGSVCEGLILWIAIGHD